MRVLSIDPEVVAPAFSVIEKGHIYIFGKFDRILDRKRKAERFNPDYQDEFHQIFTEYEVEAVAIEDQYLAYGKKRNIKNFKTLAKVAGEYELFSRLHGVEPELINPQQWQTSVLRCPSNMKRKKRKERSLFIAQNILGDQYKLDHNIADAINIGIYWDNRLSNRVPEA